MSDTSGSLTENLIDLIEAAGGSRPASKGLSELYQSLATALAAFTPGGGGGGCLTPVAAVSITSSEVTSNPPSGPATVDGYAVVTGNRILLVSQVPSANNGLWIANTSGLWTRSADLPLGTHVVDGTLIPVANNNGTFLFGSIYSLGPMIIGDGSSAYNLIVSNDAIFFNALGSDPTTGFGGSVISMAHLPTSNPHVVGQLYNNAGVVTVSAG